MTHGPLNPQLHDPSFPAEQGEAGPTLPSSIPEYIRVNLRRDIIEGRIAPGERVTEITLAERLGVSRTPVREAIRLLESEGLIVRRRGRGTYVTPLTTAEEASALFEMRIPLESYLAARAAERIEERDIRHLDELHSQFQQVVKSDFDLARLIRIDAAFHDIIYRAADTDLSGILHSYWGRLMRDLSHSVYRSEPPAKFAQQHARIIKALRSRDADVARKLMADHIRSGWKAITLSSTRESGQGTHDR